MEGVINHHYIPQFFLRAWTGADGRLERYTRPRPGKIAVRCSHPSETGFEPDLYRGPGEGDAVPHRLEVGFMQQLDSRAALVFGKLNADPPQDLNAAERSTLSVFVRGLTYRSPAMFAALKESGSREWAALVAEIEGEYDRRRGPGDPATYAAFRATITPARVENSVLDIVPSVFASPEAGQALNDLHARLVDIPAQEPELLISNDPLARTNGIMVENGHFALPISPRRLLVLTWRRETLDLIVRQSPKELVTAMNRWVVGSARHFVAARDRSQDRFVSNRFGTDPKRPISRSR